MLFNTLAFWIFFAVVLGVYLLLRRRRPQNVFLLLASYFFYGCWDWRFLALLLVSTTADWTLGNLIARESTRRGAKRWVATSVALNLTFLGFFKYFDFFVGSAEAALGALGVPGPDWRLRIVLPVGISFYTFQSISYIVDVYRGDIEPAKDPVDFALFVAFFPHMVAGPIMPSRDLLPQMQRPRHPRWSDAMAGFHLAMWGLFKKVVVADNLALVANPVFARQLGFGPGAIHLGALAFAFQIYCDFSGYSDIARGVARIMGFRLMENFDHPYLATCVTDFWRRWHISLSRWLRDYLYVPLGGNRGGPGRTYVNLMLTMVLGGLWHGAAWKFVLWGAYQGGWLVLERAVGGKRLVTDWWHARGGAGRVLWLVRVLVTFHFVCLGWLIFRAESTGPLWLMVRSFMDVTGWLRMPGGPALTVALAIAPVLAVDLAQYFSRDELVLLRIPTPLRAAVYVAGAYVFILAGRFESNAFIYFQF
jgi:D-alanyl-lipoteichoic acid acyltransferase DltB (MBOAT superfamily)